MTTIARNTHSLSLLDGEIVEESDLGSMRRITADNLPILKNLSIKRVLLNPGAMRTPHWHANADEFTYCVSGIGYRASVSAYSREVLAAAFTTHIDDLPNFPFTPADPLIVGRLNPVD